MSYLTVVSVRVGISSVSVRNSEASWAGLEDRWHVAFAPGWRVGAFAARLELVMTALYTVWA